MAIIAAGRIVRQGRPQELLEALAGQVWRCVVPRDQLDRYRASYDVISTRLRGGQTLIHVVADRAPEPGFEHAAAGLEDVYFATLARHRRGIAAPAGQG